MYVDCAVTTKQPNNTYYNKLVGRYFYPLEIDSFYQEDFFVGIL